MCRVKSSFLKTVPAHIEENRVDNVHKSADLEQKTSRDGYYVPPPPLQIKSYVHGCCCVHIATKRTRRVNHGFQEIYFSSEKKYAAQPQPGLDWVSVLPQPLHAHNSFVTVRATNSISTVTVQ